MCLDKCSHRRKSRSIIACVVDQKLRQKDENNSKKGNGKWKRIRSDRIVRVNCCEQIHVDAK
jgi:hypothetical protein